MVSRDWRRSLAAVGLILVSAACGSDDGADVRTIGTGSGSASGSATGAGTGSASASATGTHAASGTGAPSCHPVGGNMTADTEVHVSLMEYSVSAEPRRVASGAVEFEAENTGSETHELVIVKAGRAASLPTDGDGALAEDRLTAGALIGEIEPFGAGEDCHGTFHLEPGSYVLLCNVVEEHGAEREAHLEEGMHTEFEVTG